MASSHESHEQHGHYILPKKKIYNIFWILVVLTFLTVAVINLDAGPLNVPIALAIAIMKASLVVLYYMGLKHDKAVNKLTFVVGTIFVIVFLSFTLLDTAFRGDLGNVGTETISDMERRDEMLRGRDPGLTQPTEPAGEVEEEGEGAAAEEAQEPETM
jgi:cytochrome c oxidase subunit IV